MSEDGRYRRLRSQAWWDETANPGMTALYMERYLNFGLTRAELQSGRPVVGIAQTGSDLTPCNRHHLDLGQRVREGVRDAGGIALEFPVHPIQETGKRPTASLDRNLAYLGLVEVLFGYPLDAVVLTTGCDKTTPASLMAAATVNLPAIVLSGGPMLNGYHEGRLAGSGAVIWEGRQRFATGEIDYEQYMELVASSATSAGHCNTMGTALTMNSLAEALGMSLPGSAAIPAPYRERAQMAYETGRRAVGLVEESVTPRQIMTQTAFENAIVVASAIGGSTNAPIHLTAIARHAGVDLGIEDWERVGRDVPTLVNCQPAGAFLGEDFHLSGGVPAVMHELLAAGLLHGDSITVSGRTVADNVADTGSTNPEVIRTCDAPFRTDGGMLVLRGNLFDSAIMKTSVISDEFRARYLANPEDPEAFFARAIVFDGPEDYHDRIDDPDLDIDQDCILVMRYTGPTAYPGSAEVVNMQPPAALLRRGVTSLPTMGDGRQSGTSDAPSILNASPEAAAGGGLALLRTGDRVRVDLRRCRVDVQLSEGEIERRRTDYKPPAFVDQTPWQEFYRAHVGQLSTGGCLEFALAHQDLTTTHGIPRDSH